MKDWKKSLAVVSALTMLTTVTASLNLSANAVTNDTYEFENGTLDGATVYSGDKDGNAVANASGDLVFLENGGETATVTVTVPATGMYSLTIATYTPYGNKTHNLLINDIDQGQISFEENTTGSMETDLGMFKLNEGENTITVKSSWGWTYLDYIKVTDATLPTLSAEKTLSDSDATDEAKRLMCYLVDNYGEHILSGQQEIYKYGPHDFEYEFEYIKDLTGVYPAIRGFDYMNECNPLYGSEDGTTDRMIDWAKNRNGIVTASWHITVPKQFENYNIGDNVDWSNATYVPEDTGFDPSKILEDGSKEREYYMLCLETLASSIQKLQDENIPIILRPLHEAEGGGGETGSWFWWGKSGSAVYKELWKLTYNTLTQQYGLHNIIWEWNSYAYATSKNWYPGDEYVDIVAYDKYNCTDWSTGNPVLTHNDSAISGTFYNLVDMYPGKMVAMSENDSVPTLSNLTSEKAGWLYFCPWYDGGSDNINFLSNPVFNVADDLKELYQSDYCISLDELPTDLYTGYSLDGFETSDPKPVDPDQPTVTTTAKPVENSITYSVDDCTPTEEGFKFTVDNPENITKFEILGTISTTDNSTWYCAGGGVVVGLGEDDEYAFLDYQFDKGNTKATVTVDGTFKSGETDADGNNLETEGIITSNEIEITKWWTASENEGVDAVSLDITGVKVYYKDAITTDESTTDESTTDESTTDESTTDESTTHTIKGTIIGITEDIITVNILGENNEYYTQFFPISSIPTEIISSDISVGDDITVVYKQTGSNIEIESIEISKPSDTTTPSDTTVTTVTTVYDTSDASGEDSTQTSIVAPGVVVVGDVNGDGDIMGNDLLLLKKYVLGLATDDDIVKDNADINGDGDIMGNDLLQLKKYVLGLIESL